MLAAGRVLPLLGALFLFLAPHPLRAQQADPPEAEAGGDALRTAFDAYRADLEALRERLGVPGLSVAIARDGELLWAEGLGRADREAGREATAETPYRIASITKTMTAAVLVGLAREGALDLDAPVSRVLPDAPAWGERVTVRHLLSHTSESDPPGTGFTYSGRYDLLSRIAAEAAGAPFPELLMERVVEPAGLRRTYPVSLDTTGRARSIRADLAAPYLPDGGRAPEGMLRSETVGGNGVVSTAPDLVRWASALAAGRVVPDSVREAMWSPTVTPAGDTLPYGLGWWVEETPAVRLVSHGGQWPTWSGLLLHVRGPELTLAVLANHTAVSSPFYDIGTGTKLYSSFAAAFLRRFALRELWDGPPPELPWDASAAALAAVVESHGSPAPRLHLGAELFGRGLVARAAGRSARSDSLLRAVVDCCPAALAASEDLGLLFHLGRSGDPELRALGQEAGRRRLRRMPDDPLARFHLAVSLVQSGAGEEATGLLRPLLERRSEIPTWMWSWSAYLLAEQIADERPGEARRLLERVLAEGQDEGGLFDEVRALLEALGDGERVAPAEDTAGVPPGPRASAAAGPAPEPRVATARHDFDGDGRDDTLAVVMTDGRRYRDTTAWCGAGEKYEGRFAVRAGLTAGVATRLPLEAFTFFRADDGALVLADYDHDGRMDFNLGQYGSCNGWRYRLYTVEPDGSVRRLPVGATPEAWVPVQDFANSTRAIVPTGRGFEACHYDNATTHTVRRYAWSPESGRFFLASERRVEGGCPPADDGAGGADRR